MAFINRQAFSTNEPSFLYRQAIETLAETLLDPERVCVYFLGAGASVDETAARDLPTGQELSQTMAKEIGLEWHRTIPLSTIAFYYEFLRGRDRLVRLLQREIASVNVQPSKAVMTLVDTLAHLEQIGQRNVVITTNYDQQFEKAYQEKMNKPADVLIYQGAQDPHAKNVRLNRDLRGELQFVPSGWLQRKPTTLFKMHGCISQPENQGLVITEEDYINFLTNALSPFDDHKRIPTGIMGQISRGTIIFLGYSLEDWNFRTIFKATVEAYTHPGKSYAVQFWDMSGPEDDAQLTRREATTAFWGKKGVDIINAKADRFMKDLFESVTKVRV